jgi:UDPglucose--hexose-1-phosphate uridylyltransferase
VPNKYPLVDIAAGPAAEPSRGSTRLGGYHDVLIESPEHIASLTELAEPDVAVVLRAYQDRLQTCQQDPQIAYGLVFKNYGPEAGASQGHIHSQLLALRRCPTGCALRYRAMSRHASLLGECLLCRLLVEAEDADRLVERTDHLAAWCPHASFYPYETWIAPTEHASQYEWQPEDLIAELAHVLRNTLWRMETLIPFISYNYLVHTAPFDNPPHDDYHWHIEVLPRMARHAGLELGTEEAVNPVPPDSAAHSLRSIELPRAPVRRSTLSSGKPG